MIVIAATPEDVLSRTDITPEEKRELLGLLPKRIKVGSLRSPYYVYGDIDDRVLTLTVANAGRLAS